FRSRRLRRTTSNNGLNSNEAFDESTAISSSVMQSGARRVKEIADRLDIKYCRTDLGNSDRGHLEFSIGADAGWPDTLQFLARITDFGRLTLWLGWAPTSSKTRFIPARSWIGRATRSAVLTVTSFISTKNKCPPANAFWSLNVT